MKTKEELNKIKQDLESLTTKLNELTDEELKEVSGGFTPILLQELTGGFVNDTGFIRIIGINEDENNNK